MAKAQNVAQERQRLRDELRASISHLVELRPEECILEMILISAGNDLEKAKIAFQRYMEVRARVTKMTEIEFRDCVADPRLVESINYKFIGEDCQGRMVLWTSIPNLDFKKLLRAGLRTEIFIFLFKFVEEMASTVFEHGLANGKGGKGVVGFADLKGMSYSQFMSYELISMGMEVIKYVELFTPIAEKGFVVNAPWFGWTLLSMAKPFLSKETIDKLSVHGSDQKKWLEAFKDQIPLDVIPQEYGGNGTSVFA